MALVASTTDGLAELERVRAAVRVPTPELPRDAREEYRLVVQSYAATSVSGDQPELGARPLASAQRSVTAEELSRGVALDVVGVGKDDGESRFLVAWVEPGAPNLEFDGRRARPSRDAYIGTAKTRGASEALITLSRKSA